MWSSTSEEPLLGVHQRCSKDAQVPCTLYHVGGNGAQGQARMQLQAITREDVWMLFVVVFFFFFWMVYMLIV